MPRIEYFHTVTIYLQSRPKRAVWRLYCMKRIIALLLGAVLLCTMLFACRSKNDNNGSNNGMANDTEKEITLTVWESTAGPDEFIRQAGKAFTQKYPHIKIEFINVELGDASSQIALDGPAGVGPDLFAAPHDKLGELVSGGHVLPTEAPDEVRAQVLDVCADAVTWQSTMYGYPIAAETYALYYNKEIVETPPKNFDEVIAFCEKYNSGGKYGMMFDVANAYYTIIFTTGNDNLLFGKDGTDTTKTNVNTQAAIDGMTYFQSLRGKILDLPSADISTAICDEAFKSGVSAMHISGPWNIASFEDAGIDFGVTTIPALPGEDTPPSSFSGTRTMFVSAYSKNQSEANLFARFLISDEMQKLRFELTGAIPSAKIDVESDKIAGFLEQLEYSFPMPSVPQMGKFWDSMNAASANIWDGANVKKELDACDTAIISG